MPVPIEIDIRGHKIVALSFNEEKDGIPVIFIHWVTASINFWEPIQLTIIKDKVRWYSLSLPGHYAATLPNGFEVGSFSRGMITEVLSDAIRNLDKEGELHILEGVGHLPMFEKPEEYNSVIEKWIKRNI